LWSLGLEPRSLEVLAAELGADVPFFLTGGTARGRGRGDRVAPLPFAGDRSIVLGCPPFGVPTAEVFHRVAARLTLPGNGVSVPVLSAHKWPEEKDFGLFGNDLEEVVFAEWPELRGFRDALLKAGAGAALLSGSGSTVFGVFSGPGTADRAVQLLQSRFAGWRVLMTRFVREGVRWMAPPRTPDRPDGET
jgi:4-diphosphocytidyl-2-C-methyl-D-erythritol kinase